MPARAFPVGQRRYPGMIQGRGTPVDEASRGPWRRLLAWLVSLAGVLLVLSGVLHFLVFSDAFHGLEHRRLGGGRPPAQPSAAELTDRLQAYFRAPGPALMEPEVFSYRERLHYREVKRLVRANRLVFIGSALAVSVLVLAAILLGRAAGLGAGGLRAGGVLKMTSRVLVLTGALLLLVVTAAALLFLDFDGNFLRLHRLVFDSTNWVLPPYSVTVQVFPLRYFTDFLVVYGLLIAGLAVLCLASAHFLRRWVGGGVPCQASS